MVGADCLPAGTWAGGQQQHVGVGYTIGVGQAVMSPALNCSHLGGGLRAGHARPFLRPSIHPCRQPPELLRCPPVAVSPVPAPRQSFLRRNAVSGRCGAGGGASRRGPHLRGAAERPVRSPSRSLCFCGIFCCYFSFPFWLPQPSRSSFNSLRDRTSRSRFGFFSPPVLPFYLLTPQHEAGALWDAAVVLRLFG